MIRTSTHTHPKKTLLPVEIFKLDHDITANRSQAFYSTTHSSVSLHHWPMVRSQSQRTVLTRALSLSLSLSHSLAIYPRYRKRDITLILRSLSFHSIILQSSARFLYRVICLKRCRLPHLPPDRRRRRAAVWPPDLQYCFSQLVVAAQPSDLN